MIIRKNKKKIILLVLIFLVAFLLRFYKLGIVPDGLQQDETSLGYNAYSILKTGRDEHGAMMPVNFKAFGEYKLPGYIYASVAPIAIFGFTPFGIRFIAALSGFLSVIVVFYLTRDLVKMTLGHKSDASSDRLPLEYLPYLTAFLFAINPWQLHFSRAAFEATLANFFLLCGVWAFISGMNTSRIRYVYISIVVFSLSLYTYNVARIFTPVLIIILIYLFRKKFLTGSKRHYLSMILVGAVCLVPFLFGLATRGGADSTYGTLIFSSAKVQAPLQEFRSYFFEWPGPINKLLFNYWVLTIWQYAVNVLSHLSVSFYFIKGSGNGIDGVGTTGQWYVFELPLVLVGFVQLWRSKQTGAKIILAWIVSLILVTSLTREPPQATRTFFLVFPITFCSGLGLFYLINKICTIPQTALRYLTAVAAVSVCCYFIVLYFASYYVRFPVYYAKNWRTGDRSVAFFLRKNQNTYDKVIIDSSAGLIYSSLLTYLRYDPSDFQRTASWEPEDSEGFTRPKSFGKYEFRDIDWTKVSGDKRSLIITTADRKPSSFETLTTFYYPIRPVVINVGQEIFRYPATDPAYVLTETK